MKILVISFACMTFFGCNSNTSEREKSRGNREDTINIDFNSHKKVDTILSLSEIPLINPTIDERQKFAGLINPANIDIQQVSESLFFQKFDIPLLNELFCLKLIKGASVYHDAQNPEFLFQDLYYEYDFSERSFKNALQFLNEKKMSDFPTEFHLLFKRGLVITLDKKHSKITIVEYNIFVDPKFVNSVTDFFETNKNRFDAMIISLGGVGYSTSYFNE